MVLVKKKKNVNGIIYLFENHVNGNLMEWSNGLLTFFRNFEVMIFINIPFQKFRSGDLKYIYIYIYIYIKINK